MLSKSGNERVSDHFRLRTLLQLLSIEVDLTCLTCQTGDDPAYHLLLASEKGVWTIRNWSLQIWGWNR